MTASICRISFRVCGYFNSQKKYEKIDACNTRIIFDNNKELIVPCSYRSIENQVSRASRLDLILRKRKNR